jgi:hypothetical protein
MRPIDGSPHGRSPSTAHLKSGGNGEIAGRVLRSLTRKAMRGAILPRQVSMPYRSAAAFALTLLLALAGARTALAADAGEVLTFNGECFAIAGDQRTALKMGDTVHAGDVIEVPAGARLKLRMADGSVIALASGSRMTIQTYDVSSDGTKRDARLKLDSGLVRAVVAKVTEPSNFEIDTATGVAAARSTDWFVETAPDKTLVSVLDGTVAFSRAGAPADAGTVLIPPESGSELAAQGPPSPVKAVPKTVFEQLIHRTAVLYGLCQCVNDKTALRLTCLTSPDACKARCPDGNFSFVPDAGQSCRNADTGPGPVKRN